MDTCLYCRAPLHSNTRSARPPHLSPAQGCRGPLEDPQGPAPQAAPVHLPGLLPGHLPATRRARTVPTMNMQGTFGFHQSHAMVPNYQNQYKLVFASQADMVVGHTDYL